MSEFRDDCEILLVEDNPTDAELTMRALKAGKIANKMVWVKDGALALDFLFAAGAYSDRTVENGPRVVLLDLRLPKIDGLEVLQRLKQDARTRRIPVVVLTSSKEDQDVVQSYDLGVNSYIAKPVGFEDFTRVVSELGLYWLVVNRAPVP